MHKLDKLVQQRSDEKLKVLFVCATNICRSPYAEFWFKRLVGESEILRDRVEVASAAVFNRDDAIFPKTRVLMLKEGFSEAELDAHVPCHKRDCRERFEDADIIIGMIKLHRYLSPHNHKYLTLSEAATGRYRKIKDPWVERDQARFEAVMHQITDYLPALIKKLEELLAR